MRGYAPSSWSSISPFDSKYVPVDVDRRIGHTTPQKVCVVDRGVEMMA